MAFQSTTGLGVPTTIISIGNIGTATSTRANAVDMSVSNTTYPSTFQLNPSLVDAAGATQSLGTAFVIASVAGPSPAPYTLTAVAASTIVANVPQAVYTGTITSGGSNAYIGRQFVITGFVNAVNNGTFQCVASSATTLTLTDANAIAETHAGVAQDQTATATYTGTVTGGGSNAFAGQSFVVAGFVTNAGNNGTFFATGSSATTLVLDNPNAIAETRAATATGEDTGSITYFSSNASYATVSATGLITAVKAGEAIIEVSYPAFNNTAGAISAPSNVMNGTPTAKIYKEMNVHVKL